MFGLRAVDVDCMPYLDIGTRSLAGPMERAVERIDALGLDPLLETLALRYPEAENARGILRNSILREVANRAVDAFYADLWSRNRGYWDTVYVGASEWDTLLLEDPLIGSTVTGTVSRALASIGLTLRRSVQKVTGRGNVGERGSLSPVDTSALPMQALTTAPAKAAPAECSVVLILNMSAQYGGLYSYDYLFSGHKSSPLHPGNVVVMGKLGGPANHEGISIGYPESESRLNQAKTRVSLVVKGLAGGFGGRRFGVLVHLASTCGRVDGQRLDIARRYPALKLAVLAYDVQVPSELVLALDSLSIRTVAVNERPQSVIWGLQPFSVSTLLTASEHFNEAARSSSSVSIRRAIPVGMWRTDFLHEYGRNDPHPAYDRARERGQKLIVALPYHVAPASEWSGNPLAVGVEQVTHFLTEVTDLAEDRPDVFVVIRGKNDHWCHDERFAQISSRIASLSNVEVSGEYTRLNESYRLCAVADLIIAKYTSLVDEALAVGIPCVLHDYTANSRDVARVAAPYLPREIWAESTHELRERVTFALQENGREFRDWWESYRTPIYGVLNDGTVRSRAQRYVLSQVSGAE